MLSNNDLHIKRHLTVDGSVNFIGEFIPTKKNEQVKNFYQDNGFIKQSSKNNSKSALMISFCRRSISLQYITQCAWWEKHYISICFQIRIHDGIAI